MSAELPFIPLTEIKKGTSMRRPEGLCGDGMLAWAKQIIDCDSKLDGPSKQIALETVLALNEQCAFNAPIIMLDSASHLTHNSIRTAGYATGELHMRSDPAHSGDWTFAAGITYETGGKWINHDVRYNVGGFLHDVANGGSRLLVGEQVAQWLGERGLHMLRASDLHEATSSDLKLLRVLRQAHFPLDFLGLTNEQREQALDTMLDFALKYGVCDHLNTLEYLAGPRTDEQRNALYEFIMARHVDILPTAPLEDGNEPLHAMVEYDMFALAEQVGDIENLPNDSRIARKTRAAGYMAMLYKKRATQLAEFSYTKPAPQPSNDSPKLGPWPESLSIFNKPKPTLSELWQAVDHLRYLKSHNVPTAELGLTDIRAGKLEHHLTWLLIDNAQPAEMHHIYDVLEYAFEVNDDTAREQHYKAIGRTLALITPLRSHTKRPLERLAALASVYAARLPNPPRDTYGQPLTGEAATAAVIADLYKYRMIHAMQADIARDQDEREHRLGGIDMGEEVKPSSKYL